MILLRDADKHYILGNKEMYPDGICRMLGGGVEAEEDVDLAAARELVEETGLEVSPDKLVKLGEVTSQHTDKSAKQVTFISHIYFHDCGRAELKPADDVDELCYLSQNEYEKLVERFAMLPMTIDEEVGFAWGDYGKLQSFVHAFALAEVLAQDL